MSGRLALLKEANKELKKASRPAVPSAKSCIAFCSISVSLRPDRLYIVVNASDYLDGKLDKVLIVKRLATQGFCQKKKTELQILDLPGEGIFAASYITKKN